MSFLYPAVLWFLGLLSIPIFIHLFNLRRYEKIFFSNVNFLNTIKSSARAKLTIKQWLALISRLLAMAFLVVTFAVPFLPGDLNENSGNQQVIFLDNSYSNSNISKDGLTAFDNSSELLINYLAQFDQADKFYFATNNQYSRTSRSIDQIKDEISELSYGTDSRKLSGLSNIGQAENSSNYYLFSDFQKNQFDFEEIKQDTSNNYYLFHSNYELDRNVFIDTVYLDNPVLNDAVENQLNISLKNTGSETVNDLPVVFTVNDIQISANSVDLEPFGTKELIIDISGLRDEVSNCVVNIEDFPVTFDNKFYFTLKRTKQIKVLEIEGKPELKYVKRVFDSELFDFSSQSINNLNYSQIKEMDFLVLNQLEGNDAGLQRVVNEFVDQGGAVLYIPSTKINDVTILQALSNGLITINRLSKQRGELSLPSIENPFFSGIFESKTAQIDQVEATSLIKWQHGEKILSFKNGLPFLSKFSGGNGTVYSLASSLDIEQTRFAESSLFLPVIYKMVFTSLSSQSVNLYHRKDASLITYDGTVKNNDQVFKLKNETTEVIPPQRKLSGKVIFDISELELTPGFWQVCDDLGECKGNLPINESKHESIINQYDMDELDEIANSSDHIAVLNSNALEASASKGVETLGNKYFWKYALLLALVFFFVEVLILRFL